MVDRIEAFAAKLGDSSLDVRARAGVAVELRDNVEMLTAGATYPAFLKNLLPIFIKILEGNPAFSSTDPVQRLRNSILDTIHRLPLSPDALKPYVTILIDALMQIARTDNEDNVTLCMKVIMDLQRTQVDATADRVQPFLDLIQEMFDGMEQAVKEAFESPSQNNPSTNSTARSQMFSSPRPGSPGSSSNLDLSTDPQTAKQLTVGMQSFKVIAECPILVVSLFQAHRNMVQTNVRKFVPLIKAALLCQAKPQQQAHEEAEKKGEIFTGVCKEIKNRAVYGEFINAQVKTMSFLAYLLRQYAKQLDDFLPSLPNICIRMLRDCPGEKSATRKELLVAIRHIINYNFRGIFSTKVDDLLDERTLIGDGLTVYESMRPLAYSMLADLIHHVRDKLTPKQIQHTIDVFSRHMLDDFPGTSFQTMSAKLLLNMADAIANLENKQHARHFLVMILRAIAEKFAMMNREYDNAVKLSKLHEKAATAHNTLELQQSQLDEPPDWDEIDIFSATPIKVSAPRDPSINPVDDNKYLFKNLMSGLKNMFFRLKATNPEVTELDSINAPANWNDISFGYKAEEIEVITKLFHEGARVFRYYSLEPPANETQYTSPIEYWANFYMVQSSKEERELLETFATVFHSVDPAAFYEVFESQIPELFEMMFEHTALLHIPQFFLASEATSPSFCGMLLQFLMNKIEEVGSKEIKRASILLRMFKLSFMAVTLFSQQNEQVLLPHVTKLLTKSIELSTTAEEPMNYFYLLRSLFRSIGGGRFEMLYKEILPLLEMLLEILNNLLNAACKPQERHLYVELCLTVPARLSNLLPHLSYLMRPLVVALGADSDLVGQGLRTLELCVDNLTADYLDPIMAPVIDNLMQALWEHLRPAPYNPFHSHTTMRILGKLGGRNRRFLTEAPALKFKQYADDSPSFDVRLIGSSKDRALQSDIGLDLAITRLRDVPRSTSMKTADPYHKEHAFRYIAAQIRMHIGADALPEGFPQLVRLYATDLLNRKVDYAADTMDRTERAKSISKKNAQQEDLKKLLKACLFAATLSDLKEAARSLLNDICIHFVILDIGSYLATFKHKMKPFDVRAGEGPVCLDGRVLADALVETLSSDSEELHGTVEFALQKIVEAAGTVFGSSEKAEKLPLLNTIAKTFCHSCYHQEWYIKAGGAIGIDMLNKLPLGENWICDRQVDFVKALMFLIKDVPQDLPTRTRIRGLETMELILRRCCKNLTKKDLENHSSRLYQLCLHVSVELSHMNKHVRSAAQQALTIIASLLGAEIYEIMEPIKDRLLQPIYNKPLRALPFAIQIGYIEAVTYCLNLQNGIVQFSDQLNRLLLETLALTDADDETLASKPTEYRTAESIVSLRVSCLKLLSTALFTPELSSQQHLQSRNRIIAIFFKSLYSPSASVIDAAYAGLKGVLDVTNRLPRDLLENGLRPILMTLQDPKKVNLSTLDGLARLLNLLTNYFKREIGDRLITHMETIVQDPALQKTSFALIEQVREMKIVAASLNIFHLLPQQPVSQLPKIVTLMMEFERKLRRTQGSPFREPVFKYLAKNPKETWEYFSTLLGNMDHGRLFAQVVASPLCSAVRDTVLANLDDLFKNCFDGLSDRSDANTTTINGMNIVHALCKVDASWLEDKESAKSYCLEAGRHLHTKLQKDEMEPELRLLAHQSEERLMRVLVLYMERMPNDLDFFFKIIETVTNKELKMQPVLKSFIYSSIICNESVDYWRNMVMRCIELYNLRTASPQMRAFTFHHIVNPILAMDVKRGIREALRAAKPPLVDRPMVEAMDRVWRSQIAEAAEDQVAPGVDHARLELLQMSAMLLKYHHSHVAEFRKNVIKFGWGYIKLEDTINKFAAYVLVGFFISQFDSPARIVREVYNALLKAHHTESRILVTQALDLIAPVLPKRLAGDKESKFPAWEQLPKRVVTEETSNLQQLISVLHFLIRHPDLFYGSRELYIQIIIPSLPKLAQPPSPSSDSKKLALNAIELIRNWERRRISGGRDIEDSDPGVKAISMVGNGQDPSPKKAATAHDEYMIPGGLRAALIKYLAQLMSHLIERYPVPASKLKELPTPAPQVTPPPNEICRKAFSLFFDLLSPEYWADLQTDLFPRLTEQILASDRTDRTDEKTVTNVVNTLQLVRVILNFKSLEWIQSNIAIIQKLLEKPLKMENPEVQDCLHAENLEMDNGRVITPLLRKVLEAMPNESGEEDEMELDSPPFEFVRFVSTVAGETLAANNLVASINILWTISLVRPKDIDQHIPLILRALQSKLAKEHVANAVATNQQNSSQQSRQLEQSGGVQDAREAEIQTQLILKTIDIVSQRMSNLGEQRRPFLSVLASLVDKSFDHRVCEKILGMVETWIFDWNDPFPTLKEKTAVLHKMLNFEARADPHMLHKFLDLVIRIYEDPKITRTELTVRLEQSFLVGTRAQDITIRNRFINIFDRSITRTAPSRLSYVLTSQNWDTLAETFWLHQAIHLVLGSVDMNTPAQLHPEDFKLLPLSQLYVSSDSRKNDIMVDDKLEAMIATHKRFCTSIADVRARDLLEPLCQLQHTDSETAYKLWVAIFPLCWASISREDRMELEKGMVSLLTKDYHQRQIDRRPNVVQALLEGAVRSSPRFKVPPHVMKFLSKTYDTWYTTLVSLEHSANEPLIDAPLLKESNLDALIETYAGLEEDDLFYGAWRRRCKYVETNAALSYEQNGAWDKAQRLYENAQVKARTAVLPFSQGEYMIWEDHWVLCAQKLQQWDVLYEVAKHQNFNDLLLECTYRNFEQWSNPETLEGINAIVKAVSDAPTPRRIFFQAFMSLLKFYEKPDSGAEFNRVCDEATQLSIRKWLQLPKRITNAHIPILQGFQQLVELNDAQVIFQSLQATAATNLDSKSQELKLLLGSWRDRLPNVWDDINAWQSLVTWRQHIFTQINKTYLNLIQPNAGSNAGTSFAYRGYHETAWIINRFAHVARKHQLPDVCISQLSKIYTLPNIEIQEAFLKLREQAKCHYQNPAELNNGLDVINNTNLNYFGAQQKAEFYTLKGMFLAKLNHKDEANEAFGTALYYDIRLGKAWAEWGQYNDSKFRSEPDSLDPAFAAVSCYLEAASLFKNAKSRKLLSRILWLLSIDNDEGEVAKAFEGFKGETPIWYWITFIPQLLTSLSQREAHISRSLLTRIAKVYPQALYFQIRTNREDMIMIKKQTQQKMAQKQKQQGPANTKTEGATGRPSSAGSRPSTSNGDSAMANGTSKEEKDSVANGTQVSPKAEEKKDVKTADPEADEQSTKTKKPWEHSEDIMQALKTAFPLLALSMETMVDQIQKHFKCPPDEDAYRLIVALLNDGMAYIGRVPAAYAQDYKLPPATENNIRKFAETILPNHIRGSFEEDFVAKKPTMYEYVHKLRKWRDKFEEKLDHRPAHQSLENISPHLSEFRFQKFDEVEIPGQYLLHRDKNQDFIRIDRFLPDVGLVRIVGFSHRRLKIRGHDGSIHTFAVQHPAARTCRREERTVQLFRIFNGILAKKKETRRRKLSFYLPLMIPLAPSTRLIQEDDEYISLQSIFEDHCRRHGLNKDEPMLFIMEKLRAMAEMKSNKYPDQVQTLKMEAFTAIQDKWVPKTIALEYFQSTYVNFADFWLFRRQFSYQLAALTFMTYTMHMTTRYPQKMNIARGTGNIWGSELVPFLSQSCTFHNGEPVPFRLTPNLQTVMGPVATEGIYACSIQAIARSLTEPEGELEQQLSIFVRDEVMFWFTQQHRSGEGQLRERVQHNSEVIVNKTMALASPPQGPLPSTQTVIDIISKAVDPMRLAQCDPLWMAYL